MVPEDLTNPVQTTAISAWLGVAIVIGLAVRPRHVFLFYLVAWILFPNGGANYASYQGLPIHDVLDIGLLLMGMIAVVRTRGVLPPKTTPRLRWIGLTLVIAFSLQYLYLAVAYWGNLRGWVRLDAVIPSTDRLSTTLKYLMFVAGTRSLGSVVFFLGVARTARTREQLEPFLWVILILGLELLLEAVLLGVIGWPGVFARFATHPKLGSFTSLILNDYLAVGVVSASGMAAAFYFWRTRGRTKYLVAALLMVLPTALTVNRAVLLGVSVLLVLGLNSLSSWNRLVRRGVVAAGMVSVLLLGMAGSVDPASTVERVYRDTALSGRASDLNSVLLRLGLQARVLDIAIAKFPLGVGAGMVPQYVGSPDIPPLLANFLTGSYYVQFDYERSLTGKHSTNSHNIFIESVAEFGIGAILVIAAMMGLAFDYREWVKRRRVPTIRWRELRLSQRRTIGGRLVSWAALVFFGITYFFYAAPFVYVTFFVFVVGAVNLSDDPDGAWLWEPTETDFDPVPS